MSHRDIQSILILVDNLELGGIQRLAIDQSYWFTENGLQCEIISLNRINKDLSILNVDSRFIQNTTLKINQTSSSNLKRICFLLEKIRETNAQLVLSHSPRGLIYSSLIRLVLRKRFTLIGFIHQLPVMSTKIQNFKRRVYFHFADQIHAVSNQFKLEVEHLRKTSLTYRWILPKNIVFNRIGIYLPRIYRCQSNVIDKMPSNTMLFLGRLTEWKGFAKFCEIINFLRPNSSVAVFTSPNYLQGENYVNFFELDKRRLFLGKSIADYSWQSGGIHLYPSHYTDTTKHPMSISLNVLECIALGIPSIISLENYETWPEFRNSNLINLTSWFPSEVKEIIRKLENIPYFEFEQESKRLLDIIDISSHCKTLLNCRKFSEFN